MSDLLRAYTYHGLILKTEGDNAKGDCPFCDKENHFFVKVSTGQFNCRRCNAEGNVYSFLEQLWELARKGSSKRLNDLAENRSLHVESLKRWGIAASPLDNAFLMPQHNLKNKFANLMRIIPVEGSYVAYSTPGCKLHLFGTKSLLKQQTTLWVCEGPWDAIALDEALHKVRHTGRSWIAHLGEQHAAKTHGVIAVPGAGTFNVEWLQFFRNRDVRLVYDNDHPNKKTGKRAGWEGMQRVLRIADENGHMAAKLQVLKWGEKGCDLELENGYDIRDLYHGYNDPPSVFQFLESRLVEHKVSSPEKTAAKAIEPTPCETFDDLCSHFSQHLYFTDSLRQSLAVAVATVISTSIPGEQIWIRLIGPPGSGKTTIAECLSVAREFCFPSSILTGFHSGFTGGNGGPKKESSLVPQINGKCVIIKDADTLMNGGNKDRILSELRDIYDGSSRARYRNKKQADYENLRTTFLLCGTDALRSLNRSFLGERFLDCDILGDSATEEYLDSAISSQFEAISSSLRSETNEARGPHSLILKKATYGFLLSLSQRISENRVKVPTASVDTGRRIKAMAELLSFCRARVERDRDELSYRPRAELATRLVKQFAKLSACLCLVLDKSIIDKEIMLILRKIMRDTSHGFQFEVIEKMYSHPNGRSAAGLAADLNLGDTTIKRLLSDMAELGLVSRKNEPNRSGVGGRHIHLWILSRKVREVLKNSSL